MVVKHLATLQVNLAEPETSNELHHYKHYTAHTTTSAIPRNARLLNHTAVITQPCNHVPMPMQSRLPSGVWRAPLSECTKQFDRSLLAVGELCVCMRMCEM